MTSSAIELIHRRYLEPSQLDAHTVVCRNEELGALLDSESRNRFVHGLRDALPTEIPLPAGFFSRPSDQQDRTINDLVHRARSTQPDPAEPVDFYLFVQLQRGFFKIQAHLIDDQIQRLDSGYKKYPPVRLGTLCSVYQAEYADDSEPFPAIYIHLYSHTIKRSVKSGNPEYLKLTFDTDGNNHIDWRYVEAYLTSDLGQLNLTNLIKPNLNLVGRLAAEDVATVPVPLPGKKEQESIIRNLELADHIAAKVKHIRDQLVLNPMDRGILESLLDLTSGLSEEEKIRALIRQGESKRAEFKQTFFENVHTGEKDPRISDASVKNIAAFLNSDGGTLLVGVHDDGTITGIDQEMAKFHGANPDKYLLGFKNAVGARIGNAFSSNIDWSIHEVDEGSVLRATVVASTSTPCWFAEQKSFYIRMNPSAQVLTGPEILEYVKVHFR